MGRSRFSWIAVLTLMSGLGACRGDDGKAVSPGGGAGGAGGAPGAALCAADAFGTGTLAIVFAGPAGGAGAVEFNNQISNTIVADTQLELVPGPWHLDGLDRALPAARVRPIYHTTPDNSYPCVRRGQTTTVLASYAAIPSSGKLWVGNTGSGPAMLGFSPPSLAATGAPDPDVAAETAGAGGFTFDLLGNLWAIGATSADPPLTRYDAATLGTSGAKTPSLIVDIPELHDGSSGPRALALSNSYLWVSMAGANKVRGFALGDLNPRLPSPTVSFEVDGFNGPSGIAFDAGANMWVASSGDGTVARVDGNLLVERTLGSNITPSAIINARTPPPLSTPLPAPSALAFDANGNLWVNYGGTLARLTPDDLAGSGPKTVTPTVQIDAGAPAQPLGLAFDEEGGLWFGSTAGQLARLDAGQLTVSGSPTPSIIVTSGALGGVGSLAIYPAPVATPLAHRFPRL